MRVVAAILIFAWAAPAQFKSTVPLVVAPTTVKDAKGRYVDGLNAQDLVLYDNNVPQTIQMDWTLNPISLVVAVQTSSNSAAILDKFSGCGVLFSQLLAGDAGETAVLSFSDHVKLRQDFTTDADVIAHALLGLRVDGTGAATLDALREALRMLSHRQPGRRRILVVIAEKRDRSSKMDLGEVVQEVERQNAAIYWLTYSPFLTPFTHRPPTRRDRETPEEKRKDPNRDEPREAPDLPPGNLLTALTELARLRKPDLADLFTKTTGARAINFLKKNALEEAIQAVGEEVHRQYILTFEPKSSEDGQFHAIRLAVKGRPELQVRTRAGYWAVR